MTLYRFGWLLFIAGAAWEIVYHLVPLFGAAWSPEMNVLGGFGHVVVLAATVVVLFDFVRKRSH